MNSNGINKGGIKLAGYIICAMVSGIFGFATCAVLVSGKDDNMELLRDCRKHIAYWGEKEGKALIERIDEALDSEK
jgi:hypothetical protein